VFCIFGSLLAVLEVLPIIKLQYKKESKVKTVLLSLAAVLGIIVLLRLNRSGVFVWNELYIQAPMALISLIIYVGCFLAESKHFVKVYLALDGYHYIRA